mgnify:FL=1
MSALRHMLAALALLAHSATPGTAQEAVRSFGPVEAETRLVLRTTTDIAIFAPTVEAFLATQAGLAIDFEQWGSNDLYAITMAECAGKAPKADIVISSGVHQMVRLVNDGCAAPYRSAQTALLPPELRWRDEIWGISREPAVMVYNRRLVPEAEVPRTRFDLLDLLRPSASRYAGRVATYDIEESGLGFLFAFMDSQEASTFGALMEAFGRSGAVATCCSAEIIAGVAEGRYFMAYNVLGSYARTQAARNPDLGIVHPADYTLVLSRAALFPGEEVAPEAGRFLDFVLSTDGQLAMGRNHLTRVHPGGGEAAEDPAELDSASRLIALTPALLVALDKHKRAGFIRRWRETFSRQTP